MTTKTANWIATYEGDRLFFATAEVTVTALPHHYEWTVWNRPGIEKIATGTAFTREAARAAGIVAAQQAGKA